MNINNSNSHIRFSFNILDVVLGVLLCMVLILTGKSVEEKYFPVITDFEVKTVESNKSGLVLTGFMNKVRDCDFKNLIAYVKINNQSIPFPATVMFNDLETHRQAIKQTWGPWTVIIPYEYADANIQFYTSHDCVHVYTTRTKLEPFSVTLDEKTGDYKIVERKKEI